jgi:hypothetical protein
VHSLRPRSGARATSPRSLARTKSKRPPSVGHP